MKRYLRPVARWALVFTLCDLALLYAYAGISAYVVSQRRLDSTADAGVLFFDDFGDERGVSSGTLALTRYARVLYDAKKVQHLICLGGGNPSDAPRGAERMCKILAEDGVSPEVLKVDQLSWDTQSNWSEASRLMRENEWSTALLISSLIHMPRLAFLSRQSGFHVGLAPYNSSSIWRPIRVLRLWKEVHHEVVAWIAMSLLSQGQYTALIKWYRKHGLDLI